MSFMRPKAGLWLAAAALLLPLALGACGEKDSTEVVVATVGDREITLDYFERKMNEIEIGFLPEGIEGQAGREELLETIVNKEIMALKAEQLGFAEDGKADEAAQQMADLFAAMAMRNAITEAAQEVSEEEIREYHRNLQRRLELRYMVLDHLEQAQTAKQRVENGESWRRVASEMGHGDAGATGDYRMMASYGTLSDDLEEALFSLPVGQVSEPISTHYGYFVMRVENETLERAPEIEEIREKIIASVRKQKETLAMQEHIRSVQARYNFTINDEALDAIYYNLPEDLPIGPPVRAEELETHRFPGDKLGLPLMSWDGESWDVRRYQDFYNQSSSLGRPRRDRMLGGLRRSLEEIALRDLTTRAARDDGYHELPEVADRSRGRREQHMITRLHDELIAPEVKVSPAEVEEWWAENKGEFYRPEQRQFFMLIAPDEASARAARTEARAGLDWAEIVGRYGRPDITPARPDGSPTAPDERHVVIADDESPVAKAVFALKQKDEISRPVSLSSNEWLVVRLADIVPEWRPTLEELRSRVGERVKAIKAEAAFQEKVQEWKSEFPIQTFPERLMDAELKRDDLGPSGVES